MSEEMTEKEVLLILRIVFPNGKIKRYKREPGYITVYYSLPGDGGERERRVDFLPDDIYIVGESSNEPPDGVPISNGNILHRYCQYMIAKGYSEYWLDNPYVLI